MAFHHHCLIDQIIEYGKKNKRATRPGREGQVVDITTFEFQHLNHLKDAPTFFHQNHIDVPPKNRDAYACFLTDFLSFETFCKSKPFLHELVC